MVTSPFARNSTELSDHGFNLTVSEAASEFLVRRGIKNVGARPMKKTVQNFVGDAVMSI
jgi:ATP-dependent Clp protease ATP-binding subunit ClpA